MNGKHLRSLSRLFYTLLAALAIWFVAGTTERQVQPKEEPPQPRQITEAPTPTTAPEPEMVSLGEFKITHYCPCSLCCGKWADGITATGTTAEEGRTIAVDPKVIPYGSEVVIRYADGSERCYIAEDCGGAIKGNRIDVYMDSHEAALIGGVKYAEALIKKEGKHDRD